MSATDTDPDREAYEARRRLYAFLDELKRGDLQLGPADYARVDRVLLLLASRGIRPDDPVASKWLAPVLCGNPAEQVRFHLRFQQSIGRGPPDRVAQEAPPARQSSNEIAVSQQPRRELSLRRAILAAVAVVVTVAIASIAKHLMETVSPGSSSQPELPIPAARLDLSTPLFERPLALVPIVALCAFLVWRRSRRLMLLRAFAPAPHRSEKVAFATAQPRFYGDPGLRRAYSAFRRHWAAPGGSLHVRRSINATMRAGGRPELRFGTRPRTPEYVLLVDRETPRDHLSAAAALLMNQLAEERIIVARYDYFGDPRRLAPVGGPATNDGEQLRLLDVAALHAHHTILILAEASGFFDAGGRPHRWVAMLREWGRPILLTPRPPEYWDKAEQELQREGIPVIPALSQGLEMLAENLKLGSDLPMASWKPGRVTDAPPPASFDLALSLDRHRHGLTDEEPPADMVISELLVDLRAALGPEVFVLLQAVAVFPRLEPALTIYLGTSLVLNDRPLLNEARLLMISRLPWLRVGYMPEWLRRALVQGLDRPRLEQVLDLLQSFLQPVENLRSGGLSLEIGRRRGQGFRNLLVRWIRTGEASDLDDRILVDALNGRDPQQLGVPIPTSLADRLKGLFFDTEWVAAVLALVAFGLIALVHSSVMDLLTQAENWFATAFEPLLRLRAQLGAGSTFLMALAWWNVCAAILLWLLRSQQSTATRRDRDSNLLVVAAFVLALVAIEPPWIRTSLYFAGGVALMLFNLTRNWQVSETAPWRRLLLSPGPAVFEGPLLLLWIVGPSLAAAQFNFHDYVMGDGFAVLEIASMAAGALFAFCKTRFFAPSLRCSISDSWRIAVVFGLGQSLLPLLLIGVTLLGSGQLRVTADHSYLPSLAFTLTRLFSGAIALQAAFGWEEREARWKGAVAILCSGYGASLIVAATLPTISLPWPEGQSLWNIQLEAIFVGTCVVTTSRLLSRQLLGRLTSIASMLASLAALTLARSSPVLDLRSVFTDVLVVALIGLISYAAIIANAKAWQRRLGEEPAQPQILTARQIVREARAFVVDSMPWPLVPAFWLATVYLHLPGSSGPYLDFGSLILPAAVWLGYRYPTEATRVLAVGGLPLLVGLRLGPIGTTADPGTFAAALLAGLIVANRAMAARVFDANRITMSQLLFVLVSLGAMMWTSIGPLSISWNFSDLIFLIFFIIGLSRIPLFQLCATLVLLTFVAPPFFHWATAFRVGAFGFSNFLGSPGEIVSSLLLLIFGRSCRPVIVGDPEARLDIEAHATTSAFSVVGMGVLMVSSSHVGIGLTNVTWWGLLHFPAVSALLFWAGLRFGKPQALAALMAVILTAALFSAWAFSAQTDPNLSTFEFPKYPFPLRIGWQNRASPWQWIPFLNGIAYAALGWSMRDLLSRKHPEVAMMTTPNETPVRYAV